MSSQRCGAATRNGGRCGNRVRNGVCAAGHTSASRAASSGNAGAAAAAAHVADNGGVQTQPAAGRDELINALDVGSWRDLGDADATEHLWDAHVALSEHTEAAGGRSGSPHLPYGAWSLEESAEGEMDAEAAYEEDLSWEEVDELDELGDLMRDEYGFAYPSGDVIADVPPWEPRSLDADRLRDDAVEHGRNAHALAERALDDTYDLSGEQRRELLTAAEDHTVAAQRFLRRAQQAATARGGRVAAAGRP